MKKTYDKRELAAGTAVELEHTGNVRVAEQIAKDHLDEDPKYYSRLAACGMLHNPGLVPNFKYASLGKQLRWYHGTGRGYGEQILQDGFIRPRRDDDFSKYSGPDDELIPLPGRVYVTTSPNLAAQYAMDGTMFEKWDPYEKKYCFVFEIEIDGDIDVVIDEDLIAEDDARLRRMASKTGNQKLSGVRGAFEEGAISAGKLADYETSIAKQITLAASSEDAIAETEAIFEDKGFVNLAVKGPVRVVRAWKIPQSAWLRRAPKNAANMDGWEEVGMTRNGSWSQYVRGEYWYYEGQLHDADSSTGKGHEDIAMDLLIDMDQVREVVAEVYSAKGVPVPDWFDEETLASEAIHRRILNGRKPLSLTEHEFERAWKDALGKEHFDTWQAVETGGRFLQGDYERSFSMELLKKGGVRILNGYVEVWRLDKETLDNVQSALWELGQDMDPDGRVTLEEVHPERRNVKIDLAELLDAKSPKQVWDAAAYAKNGSGYYVWVIDEEGNPVEADGVSGPHELQNAKDYARIAATNGRRSRVVSRGVDPLSKSFKVVAIYDPVLK